MRLDEKYYKVKKQTLMHGVVQFICIPKLQECDVCNKKKEYNNMTVIKYAVMTKAMGRKMFSRNVCNKCYPEVKRILNNNKC